MAGQGKLQGIFTPNMVPLDERANIDEPELRRYVDEGPTEAEFAFSRRNVTGGFPLRIDSNGKLVGYLAMIGFYDLPLDYLDRFIERVEAVDRAQVADALARRVDPGRMVTVTVGPRNPRGG